MKEIVHAVERNSLEKAKKVTLEALSSIHDRNRKQFYGVYLLTELCIEVGLIDPKEYTKICGTTITIKPNRIPRKINRFVRRHKKSLVIQAPPSILYVPAGTFCTTGA